MWGIVWGRYRKNGSSRFASMNDTASSAYRRVTVCWSAGRSMTVSSRMRGTCQYSVRGSNIAARRSGPPGTCQSMSFE